MFTDLKKMDSPFYFGENTALKIQYLCPSVMGERSHSMHETVELIEVSGKTKVNFCEYEFELQ